MRIITVPIYHRVVFRSLVRGAIASARLFRCQNTYWRLMDKEDGVSFYRRSRIGLRWIQRQVAQYELDFYSRLAGGFVGRDGRLRPRHARRAGFSRLPSRFNPGGPCPRRKDPLQRSESGGGECPGAPHAEIPRA